MLYIYIYVNIVCYYDSSNVNVRTLLDVLSSSDDDNGDIIKICLDVTIEDEKNEQPSHLL